MVYIPILTSEGYCFYQSRPCEEVHGSNSMTADVFFAFPSSPKVKADSLIEAARLLDEDERYAVSARPWTDLENQGNVIFCEICYAIRSSKVVVADITELNFNVLFEVGYAYGTGTPVWPLIEKNRKEAIDQYARFKTIADIGYSEFSNSKDILTKIYRRRQRPIWERKPKFPSLPNIGQSPRPGTTGLLYLKSPRDTEASSRITDVVNLGDVPLIVDDPIEIGLNHLTWYFQALQKSSSVLIHLADAMEESNRLHVAKCALVAGLAAASGRRLLILAERFDRKPIDFGQIIQIYEGARSAASAAKSFVSEVEASSHKLDEDIASGRIIARSNAHDSFLSRIDLGESMAENELSTLSNYFVQTPFLRQVRRSGFTIVTGRKGAGKTALSANLSGELGDYYRTTSISITPKEYELTEFAHFVSRLDKYEGQGYFIESLWKFILSTEVLKVISSRISEKNAWAPLSDNESAIRDLADRLNTYLEKSLAARLVELLEIKPSEIFGTPTNIESSISQFLHRQHLSELEDVICKYLADSQLSTTILIDGLVGNWDDEDVRPHIAKILGALITATKDLQQGWSRKILSMSDSTSLSAAIFFRSDIYSVVRQFSAESDKIRGENIEWGNSDKLMELLSKRIAYSALDDESEFVDWQELLGNDISHARLRRELAARVLPRPRDILVFFQYVIDNAIARGGEKISVGDLNKASSAYSDHAYESLRAEWHPAIPDLEELLMSFVGLNSTVEPHQLDRILEDSGVLPTKIQEAKVFLLEANFLGIESDDYSFSFASTVRDLRLMLALSKRRSDDDTRPIRYQIHRAFRAALGVIG